jgi:hypothetical protein
MPPTSAFIRAWRAWLHSAVPSENFRLSRAHAPTYGVELGLDHLHSRLHSLGGAVIEGERLDYEKLAAEEFADLDRVELELEGCNVPEGEKERFRSYITAAWSLLSEMKNPFSTSGAV